MPPSNWSAAQLSQLRDEIARCFSGSELNALCFDLGVDAEEVPGATKTERVQGLITHLQRRNRLPALLARLARLRPDVPWPVPSPVGGAPFTGDMAPQPPQANPFGRTGKIQNPANYLVRQPLTNQVLEELGKGVSLSIVGASQTGKSSLLWHICRRGPEWLHRPTADFVYLNMELLRNDDEFFDYLCSELGILASSGYRLARALRGRQIVLCLDEIEKMTWDGFSLHVRTELRGLADGPETPLTLVVASRTPLARLFQDSPEMTSPLAGLCLQMEMPLFTRAEAAKLAVQYLSGTGQTLPAAVIAEAWQQSRGHPARLQQALKTAFTQIYNSQGPTP